MTKPDPGDALSAWLHSQVELSHLMVHDLKNPLAAVHSNVDYLAMQLDRLPDPREAREAVADIRVSVATLLRLLDQVASLARLEAAVVAPVPRPLTRTRLSLNAAVRQAVERSRPRAALRGITVESALPSEELSVLAEREGLELLLEGVVGNPIQHLRAGEAVHLSLAREGAMARLRLGDPGLPFKPGDFEREAQGELKRLPEARYGRGLGLYHLHLAARAFGGHVACGADPERAELTVLLPLAEP
ncbi:MAG: HAMP domain-containing histidine kinase [Deltaproteobacteria bacterium]|nr:HAMP domain-containing histidine kinase [Deltaproteobacteria bacterium]